MTTDQLLTLVLLVLSIIVIPLSITVVRGAMRWTRVELRLEILINEMKELVENKDQVHKEMIATMREDRAATDKRLRWLETNIWRNRARSP